MPSSTPRFATRTHLAFSSSAICHLRRASVARRAARTTWPCLLALSSSVGLFACGAKTGLRVPDVSEDVSPMDAREERDGFDVQDAPDVPPACVPGRFDLRRTSAEVLFVIDRSGSMAFALDGGLATMDFPRRWDVLRDAFAASLPAVARTLPFGAKFFPRYVEPGIDVPISVACSVDATDIIAPSLDNTAAILRVFDETDPVGPTPTWQALEQSARFLRARTARGVSRAILLATDGGPNCNPDRPPMCTCTSSDPRACSTSQPDGQYACLDDQRTIALIREIAQPSSPNAQPIPVFVVGIDTPVDRGPDFRAVLEAMAEAGGRPRREMGRASYYSIARPEDFTQAFDAVLRSVSRCTYVTPSRPTDPNEIDVELDGVLIDRDTTRAEGWDWTNESEGELTFFGSACAQASVDGARVNARVGCRDR